MHFITELFSHYGYIVLFIALTLELIAFPIPGETLMTYCGFLVFQGELNWMVSIVVAASGVICGITVSYLIGFYLGTPFLKKYGSYIHMGPDKLNKVSKWFEMYGNGLLVVAYFIPGIRHITGYFSGISQIPFRRFALNAYIGAFIWTATFISLGKVLGLNWAKFHGAVRKYLVIGGIILVVGLIIFYVYRNYKVQITDFIIKFLEKSIKVFHSLGKIKIAIVVAFIVFISLSILVVGLVQDFLANEFRQFDTVASYLMLLIFPESWSSYMSFFQSLTSAGILTTVSLLIFIWIMLRGRNRFLEIRFLIIVVLGGELLAEILRLIFHRLGPLGLSVAASMKYTFPSGQALTAVVVYGFGAFMILRRIKRRWIGSFVILAVILICLFAGLSALFFQIQYPSDVLAGYEFGGVWLSLNIILMEVFRILPEVKRN